MCKKILSNQEKTKYDRQIRLWGIKNQVKLQESRIIFCSFDGSNIEVLKNCILSGIGEICLIENFLIIQDYLDALFFQRKDRLDEKALDVSISFFYNLNPNSEITVEDQRNIKKLFPHNNYIDFKGKSFFHHKILNICFSKSKY